VKFKAEYVISAGTIVGHIENILNNYPLAEHIIAGDFNCPCIKGNMGCYMFNSLVTDYSFFCCDFDISSNISYTYKHDTLQQYSWLDHIFITDRLRQAMSNFHKLCQIFPFVAVVRICRIICQSVAH